MIDLTRAPLVVRLRDIPAALAVGERAHERRAVLALAHIVRAVRCEAVEAARLALEADRTQATLDLAAQRTHGAPIADFTPTAEVPASILGARRSTFRRPTRLQRVTGRTAPLRIVR